MAYIDELRQSDFAQVRGETSLSVEARSVTRPITTADLMALAASPHLAELTHLKLSFVDFEVEGIAALGGAAHLTGVKTLELLGCRMSPEVCGVLGRSPLVSRLTTLETFSWKVDEAGLAAFLGGALDGLEVLDLVKAGLGDAAVSQIVSARLPSLVKLDLRDNQITAAGVAVLGASALAAQLTHLWLIDNPYGEDGLRAFAEAPNFRRLVFLALGEHVMAISPETADRLAMSPNLSKLEAIDLSGNYHFKDWMIPLSISPYLPMVVREDYLCRMGSGELKEAAKRVSLKGRSKLKREGLIAALKERTLPLE